jgi:phosphatidylinositol alpha-mannosyltransferase
LTLRIALTHVYAWPEVRRGGERYLHELGSALKRSGHEVTIFTTARTARRGTELGVPVRYLRRRHLAQSRLGPHSDEAGFAAEVAALLAVRRVDVWHALGTADAAAAAVLSRARRTRSVYTDLGVPDKWYRDTRPDSGLHRLVVRDIDSYVCLSDYAAAALERDYGRPAHRVGGGVDLARFRPLGRRSPEPALLYSGVVDEPRKRLRLLVEAVALLRAKVPDVQLWVSGPGELGSILAGAPAAGVDAVVHLGAGNVDDQPRLYGSAWATVLPSKNEAFGLSLLESLACGTPIVASTDGGGSGDLVQPGVGEISEPTAPALAEACEAALERSQAAGVTEACRAAAAPFDWSSAIVPALERLYLATA